jgi:hypothetical protein
VRWVGGFLCLTGCPYLWGPPEYVDPEPLVVPDPTPPEPSDTGEPPDTETATDTGEGPTDTGTPEPVLDGTFEGTLSILCVADSMNDTCSGDLTVTIEEGGTPQVEGIGICLFSGELDDVVGVQSLGLEGELLGPQASGDVSLPMFDSGWTGTLVEPDFTGTFVGQTQQSVPGHGQTDFVCTGTFDLVRQEGTTARQALPRVRDGGPPRRASP